MSKHIDGIDVKGNVELTVNTDDTEIFTTIKIFGWDLWRVFRDDKKEMIKIILHKDNEFKEFVNPNWKEKKNE